MFMLLSEWAREPAFNDRSMRRYDADRPCRNRRGSLKLFIPFAIASEYLKGLVTGAARTSFQVKNFVKQLLNFYSSGFQCLSAKGSRSIYPAGGPAFALTSGSQVSLSFQTVQHWIKSPRTEFVTVPCQFFADLGSKDRFLTGVMKNVKADQARVQVSIVHYVDIRCRNSILKTPILPAADSAVNKV